jgi:NADPH:quinone reductase-like Zn-dependent oxidoreductase
MKSAQINGYGGSEVVEINQSTPAPNDPSAGKVLVNVRAAGVNPSDWKFRDGFFQTNDAAPIPLDFGMGFFRRHRKGW